MLWTTHKFSMAPVEQSTSYMVIYIYIYTSHSNVCCKMAKLKLWGFLVMGPHEKNQRTWTKYQYAEIQEPSDLCKLTVTIVPWPLLCAKHKEGYVQKWISILYGSYIWTYTFNKHPCKWSSYFAIVLVLAKFHDHCIKSLQTIKKSINYFSILRKCNICWVSWQLYITGTFTQDTSSEIKCIYYYFHSEASKVTSMSNILLNFWYLNDKF